MNENIYCEFCDKERRNLNDANWTKHLTACKERKQKEKEKKELNIKKSNERKQYI